MELKKLAPWNWFKKEESEGKVVPQKQNSSQPVRYSDPFTMMRSEMNRMFEDFNRTFDMPTLSSSFASFNPSVDVQDKGKSYLISVEVPGMEKDDVKIDIQDDLMIISGEKKSEAKEEKDSYYRIESSYGSFQRVLNLPADADIEKVDASFKNGVLKIEIDKDTTKTSSPRQISIK